MVLESGLLQEHDERYELTGPLPPLAIPTTLHDSLMARLDRLATVKGLAQLGATLGREFSYELLHAISPWDEETLRRGLQQLVEAEFLYQQGLPPQAMYVFKHALIQEAAYQSLLRSTRQRHHQHIAQVLEAHFPERCETQPELLAHHYTEAGLLEQAVPYWQRAGQRAVQRFAHREAIGHLTKGLDLLKALPDTPEHTYQELHLQTALGPAWMAAKGYAAPEVAQAYGRARALCQAAGRDVSALLGPARTGRLLFRARAISDSAGGGRGTPHLGAVPARPDAPPRGPPSARHRRVLARRVRCCPRASGADDRAVYSPAASFLGRPLRAGPRGALQGL